ncbi:MAG: T9SS type A sorting domain-containing protein [Candidatus Marinimicrobia bacterium]|nr:T9SS type A sorting domain-containing protein [Candidatus Neomarinimicrobiota bacterium]
MKNNFLLMVILLLGLISGINAGQYYIVEINPGAGRVQSLISQLNLDAVNEGLAGRVEIVADQADIDRLVQEGIPFRVVRQLSTRNIPDYQSYDDINDLLNLWHSYYPSITKIIAIGTSTEMELPIYGIKISDNAVDREDETVVWIDGVHHAREPMGMMSCMVLIEHLLANYGIDSLSTRMVNELETWIIPILNTEGYKYFIDSTSYYPWWRKNQRDNNSNGQFDFNYDGVDLNRNYDCNWQNSSSGSSDPTSWVYKGPNPFSESEVTAKKYWVEYLRPIAGITYHSYGEIIYYKSGINGHSVPETSLINAFAQQMAQRLPQLDGSGSYTLGASWGEAPMSYYWAYQKAGIFEMLVETGTEFVPIFTTAQQVAYDNLNGALYVLERSLNGPGIRGHVTSAFDSSAVRAQVKILEYWDAGMAPRLTEPTFGRFNRFTGNGYFNLVVNAEGYVSATVNNVVVGDAWTEIEVNLNPLSILPITTFIIDDDSIGASLGNDNGQWNSGERIELGFEMTNFGVQVSNEINVHVQIDDPYITLVDSVQALLPIEPDSIQEVLAAFIFDISTDCPDQHQFDLRISTSDSFGVPWESVIGITVYNTLVATDYENRAAIPAEFALHRNYPNPFNPVTTMSYSLPEQSNVSLIIYDILGNQIKTLVNDNQTTGNKTITWDATNAAGATVTAGVYFYRLQAGSYSQTGKMLLLK